MIKWIHLESLSMFTETHLFLFYAQHSKAITGFSQLPPKFISQYLQQMLSLNLLLSVVFGYFSQNWHLVGAVQKVFCPFAVSQSG